MNSSMIHNFIKLYVTITLVPALIQSQVNKTANYISYCYGGFNESDILFKYYNKQESTYENRTINDPVPCEYDAKNVTKFIITGQYSNYIQAEPIVKGYMLKDVNIIVVDWSKYSGCSHPHITNNIVPPLSKLVAKYIKKLYAEGTTSALLHLIGHSFGAHIMGLASQSLGKEKAGRVTGLDPGDGKYDYSKPQERINAQSGYFVDSIHTNLGKDGIQKSVAKVDFFPNGGADQPHCGNDDFCSHALSIDYFGESINSLTGFYSLPVTEYFDRSNVSENEEILMGEYVPYSARGNYFLTTNTNPPYAKGRIPLGVQDPI